MIVTATKLMLVHGERDATHTAIIHEGKLIEYDMEQAMGGQLVGCIFKGRIANVLPGMQAAFVDIGHGKNAFLYIDDALHANLSKQPQQKPSIADVLKPGQELLVQVAKAAIGSKGARVTTHFSLPGRCLVFMPDADYVGVSKKIEPEQERSRLRTIGEAIRLPGEGVILRTAAQGESEEALEADLAFLRGQWQQIVQRSADAKAPVELHREAGIMRRLIRDMLTTEVEEIWIDHPERYQEALRFMREMAPQLEERVHWHGPGQPQQLFQRFEVKAQLNKAFSMHIQLESGAALVWDQTEALTVIDVNTSKFTGTSHLEDTVFRTNMEAADEIARLLRLRDTGGIIIIDFIDMEDAAHKEQVMDRLEQLVRQDRTKCQVVGWTRLGLLEMTRKKAKENIMLRLYEPCEACRGKGRLFIGLP